MKKHISNHLRMVTIVMGITLASSAVAHDDNKGSKANDLLCVAIEGADSAHQSALAVLRVEKNGQARGALCYLDSLQVTDLEDGHLVGGRVLFAPRAAKASFVGLVGTGIDKDNLIQNDVAVRFKPNNETGLGAATEFTVMAPTLTPTLNVTGVGKAYQGACRYDLQFKGVVMTTQLQTQIMRQHPFFYLPLDPPFIGIVGCPQSDPSCDVRF